MSACSDIVYVTCLGVCAVKTEELHLYLVNVVSNAHKEANLTQQCLVA